MAKGGTTNFSLLGNVAERTYFTYVRSTRYTCDDLHTLYQSTSPGVDWRDWLVDWSDWNGMDWYNFGPVRNPNHATFTEGPPGRIGELSL